jgi:flavin-dependent dehydrogenase
MQEVDVAVCGGGLAGLSFALQLRRELPERSVVVLESEPRPLPAAAHKVGEATTEIGAYYLCKHLGLEKHLREEHVRKAGLRFFFPAEGDFARRPEAGTARLAPAPSYLVDRGRLETELRERCEAAGARIVEGAHVEDIELGAGDAPHRVRYRRRGAAAPETLACGWVADALGRRCLLQRKLGLARRTTSPNAAAWFRVATTVDVETFVPPEERAWHERVGSVRRVRSTSHLVDAGRWIWIIPLAGDVTSIGIVFSREFHAIDRFRNLDAALDWLRANEPDLAAALEGHEILDYRRLVGYSHTTRRVHSEQRWSCLGDAATFADPMYSPGFDLIGLGNCVGVDLVRRSWAGELDASEVAEQSRFLAATNDWITRNVQRAYGFLGNPHVMATKVLWDTASAWAILGPAMFGGLVTDLEGRRRSRKITSRFFGLTLAVQQMFEQWARRPARRPAFEFVDYLSIPSLLRVHERNLRDDRSLEEVLAGQAEDMRWLEELAQVLFRIALEDTQPERLADLPDPLWVNAWGVNLDPERWEKTRLFHPDSEPRDLEPLRREIESRLRPARG